MATNSVLLYRAFNTHFLEFIDDMQMAFPKDADIRAAKITFETIRKTNLRLMLKMWKSCITDLYGDEIEKGNLDFFINKNYTEDVGEGENAEYVMGCINRLREPIRNLGKENKAKAMHYIQNLTKLSKMI